MRAMLLASACAAAQMAVCLPAYAQSNEDQAPGASRSEEQEIIVTATRRAERLQDVPLSITAFSQEELTAQGIVGYEGLATATPGVVLNRASANFNNFTARGVATNGYGANLQSTVAVYIDELPISTIGNTTVLDPNLFDVERVEFLRGPQGTLFGSGSLAGALRILTRNPDLNDFDASVLADFGIVGDDSLRQRYNGMINVPLVEDRLALRVVGFLRDEEGYIDNAGTGINDSNALEAWGSRAILLWTPTDRLSVRLLASRELSEPQDSSTTSPALGEYVRVSDRPDLFQGDLNTYNATVEYQFDGANFTSSSTFSTFDQKFYVDLAGTFAGFVAFALDADGYQDTFVQEMRLASDPGGSWDWVIGGFYLDRRHDVDYNYRSSPEFLAAAGITGLPDEYYQRFSSHFISHELAGFGELTYRFSDDLWITAGGRYGSVDAQGFTEAAGYNSNYLANALTWRYDGVPNAVTITPIVPAVGVKAEEDGPSYRLSLSYRPTPSLTTYATISTGFRTPVVNARAGSVSVIDSTDIIIPDGADSDQLTNYEIGLKGRWLDGRLNANIAFYFIDWQDIQVQANRVSDSIQFATNIGGAESKGIELEIQAIPIDGLTIGFNGSFNEAEVTSLTPSEAAISGAVLGARLAGPEFQGSLYFNYNFFLTPQAEANFSLIAQHVGSFPSSFPNVPGRPTIPSATFDYTDSYTLVNSVFAIAFDNFTVGAYVENMFDEYATTYVHPEAFTASRYSVTRPRTFGVRVGYDF
ncbi:MAG: TonB-dependent receptor [Hyphomonadaceae bacterium]|nr:TonB-dependent receptor [Hyphomonadaceae bacterium]